MFAPILIEWEYASIELQGTKVSRLTYDRETAQAMRADIIETIEALMQQDEPDLIDLLNVLGEEGWELSNCLQGEGALSLLILKRPGERRARKDAETRAIMKRTLDEMDM
jgi:antitoxin component HigA of HigAB toxin-antitoxin module